MPATTKRRKLNSSNKPVAVQLGRGLQSFTTTSKAVSIEKSVTEKNLLIDVVAITTKSSGTTTKRILVDSDEESADEAPVLSQDSTRTIKPIPRLNQVQTPKRPIRSLQTPPSVDTPTKSTRGLLDQFRISTTTPTRSPRSIASTPTPVALNSSPERIDTDLPQDLPDGILDLINLHAAFLKALSIHYAHNGTHSPADLRNLCPDVARAWGKRAVTLEDIRRTLGILNANLNPSKLDSKISHLTLSDYGHGKICIEIKTMSSKLGRIARPINEDSMNKLFVREIVDSWTTNLLETSISQFIEELPLERITTCSSLLKSSPMLAKGQRRLEDFRADLSVKAIQKSTPKPTTTPDGKHTTLLDRIRAKQLYQSTLAPLPSKEALARKAAIGKVEEVIGVIAMMSSATSLGQSRVSFTMPTVVQKVKDSGKGAMSREEAEGAVRLVGEVCGGWVRIVKMGRVEMVVVNREERLREEVVRERVRALV